MVHKTCRHMKSVSFQTEFRYLIAALYFPSITLHGLYTSNNRILHCQNIFKCTQYTVNMIYRQNFPKKSNCALFFTKCSKCWIVWVWKYPMSPIEILQKFFVKFRKTTLNFAQQLSPKSLKIQPAHCRIFFYFSLEKNNNKINKGWGSN